MKPVITLVTPAFNEENNIPILYNRLVEIMGTLDSEWEWIIVDDHSSDGTYNKISEISKTETRIKIIRLAHNYGSHMAITCGLHNTNSNCAIVLASDLQDPPELIPDLINKWKEGAKVVWAARNRREGEKKRTIVFSRLYYYIMRHLVGIKGIPTKGSDFFLIDREVIDSFNHFKENNINVTALITWMGFDQTTIFYDKKPRLYGQSGWNLDKKFKFFIDSITSFTSLPIRLMSYLGFFVALLGFIFAIFVIVEVLTGNPAKGWASIMVVILVLGGLQMIMMGTLGEYLWRTLDESRRRPQYLIEKTKGLEKLQEKE